MGRVAVVSFSLHQAGGHLCFFHEGSKVLETRQVEDTIKVPHSKTSHAASMAAPQLSVEVLGKSKFIREFTLICANQKGQVSSQ